MCLRHGEGRLQLSGAVVSRGDGTRPRDLLDGEGGGRYRQCLHGKAFLVPFESIFQKVTGFSIDYAQNRLDHLRQDGIDRVPMHFNVSHKINSAREVGLSVAIVFCLFLSL